MEFNYENSSHQRGFWKGEFGDSYVERNLKLEEANRAYKAQTGILIE